MNILEHAVILEHYLNHVYKKFYTNLDGLTYVGTHILTSVHLCLIYQPRHERMLKQKTTISYPFLVHTCIVISRFTAN